MCPTTSLDNYPLSDVYGLCSAKCLNSKYPKRKKLCLEMYLLYRFLVYTITQENSPPPSFFLGGGGAGLPTLVALNVGTPGGTTNIQMILNLCVFFS
jgi:hypothetical protein